jgi:hypothetical protein
MQSIAINAKILPHNTEMEDTNAASVILLVKTLLLA